MKVLKILLLLPIALFIACASLAKGSLSDGLLPVSAGPWITYSDSAAKTATVSFFTVKEEAASLEIYDFKTNITNVESSARHYHHFNINTGGHEALYRILTADETLSEKIGSVRFPQNDTFRFALYGESGTNESRHEEICLGILKQNPLFVVNTGGLVENPEDGAQWAKFFRSGRSILTNTAFIPGTGGYSRSPMVYQQAFPLLHPGGYYSYHLPGTKLMLLNTDGDYKAGSEQYVWLTNELACAGNCWKIVVFREPPVSSTGRRSAQESQPLMSELVPVLEKYRVNLVLNGRDRIYERYEKDHVVYITSGGGGAAAEPLAISNSYRLKAFTDELHYALFDLDEKKIQGYILNEKGIVLDAFEIIE